MKTEIIKNLEAAIEALSAICSAENYESLHPYCFNRITTAELKLREVLKSLEGGDNE